VTQSLRELQRSIDEVKKEQNKLRVDALKLTAEELKLKAMDQKIDEIRRDIEDLRRRVPPVMPPGRPRPQLPAPQPGKATLDMPAAAPAHITVRLPADARLTVHGVECPLTSETRTFDTPALAPGQNFYYLLKAEVLRDGRPIAQTRRVDFRSGEQVTVSFDDLGAMRVSSR
jgi:uncharacterized protein (TIGR03000 family)